MNIQPLNNHPQYNFDVSNNTTKAQYSGVETITKLKPTALNVLASNPTTQIGNVSIVALLGPRKISFEYIGDITIEAIKRLTQLIDEAIIMYQPEEINLHMQSPGGAMAAVDFWLYKLVDWKAQGFSIKTSAGTICASAAATIVALGLIGERQTSLTSVLVFHNPRLQLSGDRVVLEEDAEDMVEMLKISRESMHQMLKKHMIADFGPIRFAKTLCQRSAWLKNQSIDDISILNKYIPQRKRALIDLSTIYAWADIKPQTIDDANNIIKEWTIEIEALFKMDIDIDQYIAWALMLVDKSEKLPVIVHPYPDSEKNNHSFDLSFESNENSTSSFRQ